MARGAACGNNDMDIKSDQLGRKVGQSLDLSLGIALLDDEVLPLDVAQITETLQQVAWAAGGRGTEREPTDPEDFARLRCLGSERRREQTQGERDKAPDGTQHHGHIIASASCRQSSLHGSRKLWVRRG